MKSNGKIVVENQCTINDDLRLRRGDTLVVEATYPDAIVGSGHVDGGTIRRKIQQDARLPYRFESRASFVRFDSNGTLPAGILITSYPDTSHLTLEQMWLQVKNSIVDTAANVIRADSVGKFSKWAFGRPRPQTAQPDINRLYVIEQEGGTGFLATLSLRYDQSEVPLGVHEDSLMLLYSPFREFAVSMRAGWNMVSLPLEPIEKRKLFLYPSATTPAYTYSNSSGYVQKDTLESCVGYWMKFSASGSVSITGEQRDRDTIAVESGWNMIGSISVPVAVADIVSEPPGLTTSKFFGYSGVYTQTDNIHTGVAYWVKAKQAGQLILASSSSPGSKAARINIVPDGELLPPPPDGEIANLNSKIPNRFGLAQNFPNPFNPTTNFEFRILDLSRSRYSMFWVWKSRRW